MQNNNHAQSQASVASKTSQQSKQSQASKSTENRRVGGAMTRPPMQNLQSQEFHVANPTNLSPPPKSQFPRDEATVILQEQYNQKLVELQELGDRMQRLNLQNRPVEDGGQATSPSKKSSSSVFRRQNNASGKNQYANSRYAQANQQ